jgi:hypothetical protein
MKWSFFLAFFMLASCSSNIVYDYDSRISFNQFTEFHLVYPRGNEAYTSLDDKRVQESIIRELSKKGLVQSKGGPQAILVHYVFNKHKRLYRDGFTYGLGTYHRHLGFETQVLSSAKEVQEKRLIVELLDPISQHVIWRATSKHSFPTSMNPKKKIKYIGDLISEIFSEYPPRGPIYK